MIDQPTGRRRAVWVAAAALAAALAAPVAFAKTTPPKLLGNAAAGKSIFTLNCGTCHTLKAAGSDGQIGPDLDTLSLTEATIIKQVSNGGSSLMGKAASKYQTQMVGYKGVLTTAQIEDVAAFVYTAQHH